MFREPPVQHAIEPARLGHVALEPIGAVLLARKRDEMVHLARHRAEAAHLPHQPFVDGYALLKRCRQELSGLFAEIEQDGAGFEYADGLALRPFGIDDRRYLV